eukprot:11718792-Alexandrium_andersonii.AAC.1
MEAEPRTRKRAMHCIGDPPSLSTIRTPAVDCFLSVIWVAAASLAGCGFRRAAGLLHGCSGAAQ